jgi:hypothetical protein
MAQKQYANKRDANESQIIEDLNAFGASVIQLDKFDLIVGHQGQTHLMEIKNPNQDWSVTPAQRKIYNTWLGSPMHLITTSEQAINILRNQSEEATR